MNEPEKIIEALIGEFGRVEVEHPYDAETDFARARDYGFAIIRERMAAGGPGWLIGASDAVEPEPPSPSWLDRVLAALGWRSQAAQNEPLGNGRLQASQDEAYPNSRGQLGPLNLNNSQSEPRSLADAKAQNEPQPEAKRQNVVTPLTITAVAHRQATLFGRRRR
jgi:hypothetical protein